MLPGQDCFCVKNNTLFLLQFHRTGIHNYSQRHLEEAVKFVRDTAHKFPYTKLLDPTIYQLENISEAIEAAKSQKFHRTIVKAS